MSHPLEKFDNIEEYILNFPTAVQAHLNVILKIVRDSVPEAKECISYDMPTLKLNGKSLLHFGAFKNHIGLYATPTGHEKFQDELSKYKHGKGSVQFPHNEPLPLDLIRRLVEFRRSEVLSLEKK